MTLNNKIPELYHEKTIHYAVMEIPHICWKTKEEVMTCPTKPFSLRSFIRVLHIFLQFDCEWDRWCESGIFLELQMSTTKRNAFENKWIKTWRINLKQGTPVKHTDFVVTKPRCCSTHRMRPGIVLFKFPLTSLLAFPPFTDYSLDGLSHLCHRGPNVNFSPKQAEMWTDLTWAPAQRTQRCFCTELMYHVLVAWQVLSCISGCSCRLS